MSPLYLRKQRKQEDLSHFPFTLTPEAGHKILIPGVLSLDPEEKNILVFEGTGTLRKNLNNKSLANYSQFITIILPCLSNLSTSASLSNPRNRETCVHKNRINLYVLLLEICLMLRAPAMNLRWVDIFFPIPRKETDSTGMMKDCFVQR